MDKKRYQAVIKLCCLGSDLKGFVDGDETIIEDSGANLSGGQKQRINLARSVYREADIYLFDDPLSEIDPKLRQLIFKQIFSNQHGFLKNKVVINLLHTFH